MTAGFGPETSCGSITAVAYRICDRSKDLVKSGGEWISSVDLENELMAHHAVAEAAVIAIPDDRWGERPLAAVVLRDGMQTSSEELREHLRSEFAKWQLPDRSSSSTAIPRTATGKFKKTELRRSSLSNDRHPPTRASHADARTVSLPQLGGTEFTGSKRAGSRRQLPGGGARRE